MYLIILKMAGDPTHYLDLLHPSVASRVSDKQECQQRNLCQAMVFHIDDFILVYLQKLLYVEL